MPHPNECVWHWTTFEGLRVKQLFEAVTFIVREARLVVTPTNVKLVNQRDRTETMFVEFNLFVRDLVKSGTYHTSTASLMIPLNLQEWSGAIRNIRAKDSIGICVTKKSAAGSKPTLDLYIKQQKREGSCYRYVVNWLNAEWGHFGYHDVDDMKAETHNVLLESAEFKRLLTNVHTQTMALEFGPSWCSFVPKYDKTDGSQMTLDVWSAPAPCGKCMGCAEKQSNQMAHMDEGGCLRLENETNSRRADRDVVVSTPCYNVSSLERFTKATKLSKFVTLTYCNKHALVIDYCVQDWGTLLFRLYANDQFEIQ